MTTPYRNIIGIAEGKPIAYIEVRPAALCLQIVAILWIVGIARTSEESGGVVDRLGPSVGTQQAQPKVEPLLKPGLQAVIRGTGTGHQLVDVVELWERRGSDGLGSRVRLNDV